MALTTRTITNVGQPLYGPAGEILSGVTITFTLRDADRCPTDAWDATTHERVAGLTTVITDANGEFTVALWPNDRGSASTWYLVTADSSYLAPFEAALATGAVQLDWLEFKALGATVTPVQLELAQSVLDGSVTDAKIGDRTVDEVTPLAALVGGLSAWLKGLVYQIKAITGAAHWYTAPGTTLAATATHIAAAQPHTTHLCADGSVPITGAIVSSGGSTRGTAAIDLQITRDTTTKCATGDYSAIAGGASNEAAGNYDAVAGGAQNSANGGAAAVGGGYANQATGGYSAVPGGYGNLASGAYSHAHGQSCTASGAHAHAHGKQASAPHPGQAAHSAGQFATAGDAQVCDYILRNNTYLGEWLTLWLDGVGEYLQMPDDTTWLYEARIVGRCTQPVGNVAAWILQGVISRDNNSITHTLTNKLVIAEQADWDVNITTGDWGPQILVISPIEIPVLWVCHFHTVEVTG